MFKKSAIPFLTLTALAICLGVLFYINQSIQKTELEKRNIQLEKVHKEAISQFKNGIQEFAIIVSAMRAFIEEKPEMPDEAELQNFTKRLLRDVNFDNSLVASFVDTAHIFQFSFTRDELNPIDLKGKSVRSLRDSSKIIRLNELLQSKEIQVFPPMNLIEGWAGIPIDFRVEFQGEVIGYVAPIINFKNVIDKVYKRKVSNDFVFMFKSLDGATFDREAVYNGTEIYNKNKDPEYFKNFDIDPESFIFSDVEIYNFDFTIGTAYKHPYKTSSIFTALLFGSFLLLFIAVAATLIGFYSFKKLSKKIEEKNVLLEQQYNELLTTKHKLEELNKANSDIFSVIAHDIRSPLSVVTTYLSILHFDSEKDPETNSMFMDIQKSIKGALKLLDDLMQWSVFQTENLIIHHEPINLSNIATESAGLLKSLADNKKINFTVDYPDNVMAIGDEKMVATIFRNLISNAIKFTHPGGNVSLKVKETENNVSVSVSDDGIGINKNALKNIFNLNKKEIRLGTANEKGFGLGLHLCKEFIDHLNGQLEVKSQPFKNTTFTFTLPKKGASEM